MRPPEEVDNAPPGGPRSILVTRIGAEQAPRQNRNLGPKAIQWEPDPRIGARSSNIDVTSFNICRVSNRIIDFIYRSLTSHIILLQEFDKQDLKILKRYSSFVKVRETNRNLVTFIHKDFTVQRREDLETDHSLITEIFFRDHTLLVVNIHQKGEFKQEYQALLKRLANGPAVIGGDFNLEVSKIKVNSHFSVLNPGGYYKTHRWSRGANAHDNGQGPQNYKYNAIDSLIVHKLIPAELINIDQEFVEGSDHKPITARLQLPDKWMFKTPQINNDFAKEVLKQQEQNNQIDINQFYAIMNQQQTLYKIRVYRPIKLFDWGEQLMDTQQYLFTKQSKKFYDFIKHTANLKPDKRDGSIVSCFRTPGGMVSGYNEVTHLCIEYLAQISDREGHLVQDMEQEQIKLAPYKFSKDQVKKFQLHQKALSFDGISAQNIIQFGDELDLWDIGWISNLKMTLQMRLIPLNKTHPDVPEVHQFRPIMVQSHTIKMIEERFVDKLHLIVSKLINNRQTGFVRNLGTQLNIYEVNQEIQGGKLKANKKVIIFMDLTSAYNTVNRERLFEVLKTKYLEYIPPEEIEFLRQLYNLLYIWDPVTKAPIHFGNGLHQGSTLAPLLFDIYMNEFIEEFIDLTSIIQEQRTGRRVIKKEVKIWAYADDLAISSAPEYFWRIKSILQVLAKKYGFIINKKKTKVMETGRQTDFNPAPFEKVQSFCYLGIHLNNNGNMNDHEKYVRKKFQYMQFKLNRMKKLLPDRHRIQIWNCYFRTHFIYMGPMLKQITKAQCQKWEMMYTSSIKYVLNLHKCYENTDIKMIFGNVYQWTDAIQKSKIIQDQRKNYGDIINLKNLGEMFEQHEQVDSRIGNNFVKMIPASGLFEIGRYAHYKCSGHNCHNTHMTRGHMLGSHGDGSGKIRYKWIKLWRLVLQASEWRSGAKSWSVSRREPAEALYRYKIKCAAEELKKAIRREIILYARKDDYIEEKNMRKEQNLRSKQEREEQVGNRERRRREYQEREDLRYEYQIAAMKEDEENRMKIVLSRTLVQQEGGRGGSRPEQFEVEEL